MTAIAMKTTYGARNTTKLVSRLPRQTWINYFLNGGLAAVLIIMVIMISGIAISERLAHLFIGIGSGNRFGESFYQAVTRLGLALMMTHIALQWKWIVTHTKKYILGGN